MLWCWAWWGTTPPGRPSSQVRKKKKGLVVNGDVLQTFKFLYPVEQSFSKSVSKAVTLRIFLQINRQTCVCLCESAGVTGKQRKMPAWENLSGQLITVKTCCLLKEKKRLRLSASVWLPTLPVFFSQECRVCKHPVAVVCFFCFCVCVNESVVRQTTSGVYSRQCAVIRAVAVGGRVWACSVREHASWGDDHRPPLLLLAAFPLCALDVLNSLRLTRRITGMSVTVAPSSVHMLKWQIKSYLDNGVQVLPRRGDWIDNRCWAHGNHGNVMGLGLNGCRDDDCGVVCRFRWSRRGQHLTRRNNLTSNMTFICLYPVHFVLPSDSVRTRFWSSCWIEVFLNCYKRCRSLEDSPAAVSNPKGHAWLHRY